MIVDKALILLLVISAIGSETEASTPAFFEDRVIDLSRDWEEAEACYSDDEGAWCFRTEGALDDWLARGAQSPSVACSGTLRLYDNTNYGAPVLALGTSSSWINLSSYSFNNRTSSYRVGVCDSIFADGASGGSPHYPSSLTDAHSQASSMMSGWNNRVSSVLHS